VRAVLGTRAKAGDAPPRVSIVVVTHNALRFVLLLLRSLRKTRGVPYELVVVDNRSRLPLRFLLSACAMTGVVNRLVLLDRNTLFAHGNNLGVSVSSPAAAHVLLLNSDIEIRAADWLERLLAAHRPGATSYGFVESGPMPRADGYCLLVDRSLMLRFGLDEEYEWYWSITKLQAELLQAGFAVRAVRDHDDLVHHFGGKSGNPKKLRTAKGMDVEAEQVRSWFGGASVDVLDRA
jgi:GT2 family glycosyltransferase